MLIIAIIISALSISQCLMIRDEKFISDHSRRLKRDSQPGVLAFGQNLNTNLAPLSRFLPDPNIGRSSNGQVNIRQPSGSYNRNTDVLGLYSRQQGVEGGLRGNNNVGASWGDQSNIMNGALGWGKRNNINYNGNRGDLTVQKQKGIPGLYTETDHTNVNPFQLNFANQKQKCFGGMIFGGNGICTTDNKGFGPN